MAWTKKKQADYRLHQLREACQPGCPLVQAVLLRIMSHLHMRRRIVRLGDHDETSGPIETLPDLVEDGDRPHKQNGEQEIWLRQRELANVLLDLIIQTIEVIRQEELWCFTPMLTVYSQIRLGIHVVLVLTVNFSDGMHRLGAHQRFHLDHKKHLKTDREHDHGSCYCNADCPLHLIVPAAFVLGIDLHDNARDARRVDIALQLHPIILLLLCPVRLGDHRIVFSGSGHAVRTLACGSRGSQTGPSHPGTDGSETRGSSCQRVPG